MPEQSTTKLAYYYKNGQYYAITAADKNLAVEYDPAYTYSVGDLVMFGSNLYRCVIAVSEPEEFDPTKWQATKMAVVVEGKQDELVSGTNIKTINKESILGSGNIEIEVPEIDVDDAMSSTSENPVQNKVITAALGGKVDTVSGKGLSANDFTNTYKGNVDANTTARHTHANKSILDDIEEAYTTAEQTKLAGIEAGAEVNTVTSVAGKTGAVTLAKGDVGLGNVDNTSDLNKPVSTATQTALDAKQATLVSGTNIKTINNESILGSGDLEISQGTFLSFDITDATEETVDNIPGYTWDITTSQFTSLCDPATQSVTVDIVIPGEGNMSQHYIFRRDTAALAGVLGAAYFFAVDSSQATTDVAGTAMRLRVYRNVTWLKLRIEALGELASNPVKTINSTAPTDGNISLKTINGNQIVGSGDITIQAGVTSVAGRAGDVVLSKSDVGLGNVDNKSEATIKSDFTGSVATGNTGFVTGGAVKTYVDTALDNLPEPMIFKGTLGTGGTITSLPTAAAANEGFTYKVITAGTYASQAAKVGDVFISNGSAWVLVPAGDDVEDTWREVKINGTSLLGTGVSTGAVNFKNGSNVTVTGSGNDITISSSYTDTNQTIKGNGTAFSANDAINIVGGGATTVTADTTNKKITISTPAVTDTNQTVKGNGTAFGADAAVNIVGGGATTVTADTTNNKITISTPAVTDTNQKVKAGSVTFGADDVVDFVAGSNVTVTGLASGTGAPKVTISATDTGATSVAVSGSGNAVSDASYDASTRKITLTKGVTALTSHQSIKTLDTTATTAQSTSASEAVAGSGKVTLHKVAKTGTYSDLIGTPSLATVATSGSYNDLSNKPTIPAAQVSSDWNATSGVAKILNKPSLATVATSGSYNDLSNKPTIPTVDSAMSTTSTNPVQNKVVNAAITAASTKASKVVINGTEYTATFDATTGVLTIN